MGPLLMMPRYNKLLIVVVTSFVLEQVGAPAGEVAEQKSLALCAETVAGATTTARATRHSVHRVRCIGNSPEGVEGESDDYCPVTV
jgi:hypothetical protein